MRGATDRHSRHEQEFGLHHHASIVDALSSLSDCALHSCVGNLDRRNGLAMEKVTQDMQQPGVAHVQRAIF